MENKNKCDITESYINSLLNEFTTEGYMNLYKNDFTKEESLEITQESYKKGVKMKNKCSITESYINSLMNGFTKEESLEMTQECIKKCYPSDYKPSISNESEEEFFGIDFEYAYNKVIVNKRPMPIDYLMKLLKNNKIECYKCTSPVIKFKGVLYEMKTRKFNTPSFLECFNEIIKYINDENVKIFFLYDVLTRMPQDKNGNLDEEILIRYSEIK